MLNRVYCENGHYLVAVRYPGQWHNLQDFIQPDNPDVIAVYSRIGPEPWNCLDFVCRNISYRRDIGEFWQTPSETLAKGQGDCEDTAILLASLIGAGGSHAHVALGGLQGYGHAWCAQNGFVYETTYTRAQRVPNPEHYCPYCLFDDQEVIELWVGALGEVFSLRRDEREKLNLMAEAVECMSL